jgi:hypothetical protein
MGFLSQFTKGQRRYLSRRVCGWCELPLHRDWCGSIYGNESCTEEAREQRARKCLEGYKPRSAAPGGDGFPITNTEAEVVPGTKGRKANNGVDRPGPRRAMNIDAV